MRSVHKIHSSVLVIFLQTTTPACSVCTILLQTIRAVFSIFNNANTYYEVLHIVSQLYKRHTMQLNGLTKYIVVSVEQIHI